MAADPALPRVSCRAAGGTDAKRVEADIDALRTAHDEELHASVAETGDQLHPRRAIEYRVQSACRFQTCEPRTYAEVNAVAEPEVWLGFGVAALEAECVGILEHLLVAVRRCVADRDR